MRAESRCVCCDSTPTVDFYGLCADCGDALTRWLSGRRDRLRARKVAR